jgi:NTE family protein
MQPAYMAAYVAGREVDEIADAAARAGEHREGIDEALALARSAERDGSRPDGSGYRLARALPPIGPGSWRLALNTLRHPQRHSAAELLCGWLPRGFVHTDPISELVEAFIPGDWPEHDSYWAVAADYATGRRVAFGRDDAPPATVSKGSRQAARSRPSTTRSPSAAAATSTAASARPRTSICSATPSSTSSSA